MRAILTILVVVLILPSGLFFVLTSACTGMYSGRRPSGPDAMGLAIPFFTTIAAALATLLATWITVGVGGFNWLSPSGGSNARSLAFLIASALAVGVGLGSFMTFIGWAEGRSGSQFVDRIFAPVGVAVGFVGPLLFCVIVLISALNSTPHAEPGASIAPGLGRVLRVMAYGLAPLALMGFLMGGVALAIHAKHRLAREAAIAERYEADRKEEARREALSPVERLREDMASHSPETPLWIYIASLPDEQDQECRELSMARAMKVPNFEQEFAGTLMHSWPRFVHGCLVLLLTLPGDAVIPTAAWADALAKCITTIAGQIRDEGAWLTPDHHRNPDPSGLIRAMVAAHPRLGNSEAVAAALAELRSAVAAKPTSPERDEALAAFDGTTSGSGAGTTAP